MSDAAVAKLLRDMEIDIAIDLNGFTDGGRVGVFAHRPAPVHVNYLGFAGTMGHASWDYILADRFVISEESHHQYTEKVVYLPHSFMATNGGAKISERRFSRFEAGLPEDSFVFCCFNNSFKITPWIFDVWIRLLHQMPDSVLWLSTFNETVTRNLRREAEARGVPSDRVIFAPRIPSREDHIARLGLANLFLDTHPYNAHATAVDALWAGVPVITCAGTTFPSRVAGSLLTAIGLPDLVVHSFADYEALAASLARDPAALAELRRRLADNRNNFPLFDTRRFTRDLEASFTIMWERVQADAPPAHFSIL
jgi:predicted O-linked N-acetylglucosamine transferase (SPINDLY family)